MKQKATNAFFGLPRKDFWVWRQSCKSFGNNLKSKLCVFDTILREFSWNCLLVSVQNLQWRCFIKETWLSQYFKFISIWWQASLERNSLNFFLNRVWILEFFFLNRVLDLISPLIYNYRKTSKHWLWNSVNYQLNTWSLISGSQKTCIDTW